MAGLQSVEVFDRRCNCIRIREPDILRKMYRPLLRLRGFIAALLVAVLVIMPVADAFVCSFEVDTHAAIEAFVVGGRQGREHHQAQVDARVRIALV